MLGSGWHRLSCGAAVLVDEDDQPVQVCDLGTVTLDIDESVFAGDQEFSDMLMDELRELGWEVLLDSWVPATDELRSALALELDDDRLAEQAAHSADVLHTEAAAPSTPPLRPVPGLPGIEVDSCGSVVVQCLDGERIRKLPLQESGGVLEVEVDGETWCVDELVRRAWDDDPSAALLDEGRAWP